MRHKFLVLTVKKLLKSVYIYGSYREIKTGVSLFWTTLYNNVGFMSRKFRKKGLSIEREAEGHHIMPVSSMAIYYSSVVSSSGAINKKALLTP